LTVALVPFTVSGLVDPTNTLILSGSSVPGAFASPIGVYAWRATLSGTSLSGSFQLVFTTPNVASVFVSAALQDVVKTG
jgi:hypothetical protein